MKALDFNPYTWDNSSKMIKSSVTDLELQSEDERELNVSNLNNDIEIVIPISNPQPNSSNMTGHFFLKPQKMSIHSYFAEQADVPVTIRMSVQKDDVVLELFVKYGSRPTIDDFDQNFTVAFVSTCEKQTHSKQNATSCYIEDRFIKVLPSEPALLYVGVLFIGAKNTTEHSRRKRSCFGHGRQRRSCVGFKDPPPEGGVARPIVPQYDPSTDLNYTMSIAQSICLYWSEDKDIWTSDGCKVNHRSS